MKQCKIPPCQIHSPLIREAGEALRLGKLVVFPTETVYGIGACAENRDAVARLHSVKNRPRDKPFSCHFGSLDHFFSFAGRGLDARSEEYFRKWLPRECATLIYQDHERGKKIGVRIVTHPIGSRILLEAGCPVFATSANFSGTPPPVSIEDIGKEFLSLTDWVIDSGLTNHQKESTVIDISDEPYRILRPGAFQP